MKRPVPCRGEISRALIDAATHEGIVVHDGGRILAANRAFAALLGFGERDVPVGAEIAGLVPPPLLAAGPVPSVVELDRLTAGGALGGSGGPAAAVEIVARQLAYEGRAATVLAVRDVSERRLTQAALRGARSACA
jgi:PAS domain-containing protein